MVLKLYALKFLQKVVSLYQKDHTMEVHICRVHREILDVVELIVDALIVPKIK